MGNAICLLGAQSWLPSDEPRIAWELVQSFADEGAKSLSARTYKQAMQLAQTDHLSGPCNRLWVRRRCSNDDIVRSYRQAADLIHALRRFRPALTPTRPITPALMAIKASRAPIRHSRLSARLNFGSTSQVPSACCNPHSLSFCTQRSDGSSVELARAGARSPARKSR